MKFSSKTLLVICTAFLTACQTVPPLNFSVPNVGISEKKINAEVKSMTVTLAHADEVTGPMPPNMGGVAGTWQVALVEAINKMAIFTDDSKKKLNLSVKVTSIDIPSMGVAFTTKTTATYEITDRSNGDVIYTRSISSEGTTPMDFAFNGLARKVESINRAVENNITLFLQDLNTLDVSKPMFPSKR